MTEIIFCVSLIALVYIYLGYPLIVLLLAAFRPRHVRKESFEPCVSILIAAYNEERHIRNTIRNKLAQNYPKDKIEIIIISDGSNDKTDVIVQSFSDKGVKFFRQEPRKGKTAALNFGVQQAKGEIILFSDANSIYDPEAVRNLTRNFHDPKVGYVTGKMIYTNDDGTVVGDGCSAYMKYENFLREQETKVGSIVGVDGGIDAIRKKLYRTMSADQLPDFILPLRVVEQGFRVVYEPDALLREPALKFSADEYKMRVRVSLRALWALHDMRHLLNFRKFPLFAWNLFSHKVLRYGAFFFLITMYCTNAATYADQFFFGTFFILQNLFYAAALLAYALERAGRKFGPFYIPYYFTLLNLASAHAFAKFTAGQKIATWTPRKG